MIGLRPCYFTFDDDQEFPGFANGSRWNGFDNVWVTPVTLKRIVAHFRRTRVECDDNEQGNRDMLALPVGSGLVCLGWCYATRVVRGGYL